jgi:hypothetical protein
MLTYTRHWAATVHALSELGAPDRSRHDVKNLWLGGWRSNVVRNLCGVFFSAPCRTHACGAFGVDHVHKFMPLGQH